ncbi:hypothetical protein [Methylobacterium sp. JK268]
MSVVMIRHTLPVPERTSRPGSFVAALGALVRAWPSAKRAPRYPHRPDLDALRGDGLRIGADMRRAITREGARVEASVKA